MMSHDIVARICHEVNKVYCELIGDLSQPHWEDAPEWQRTSASIGVDQFMNCYRKGKILTCEALHKSWVAEKVKDGWAYGPIKDPVAKTHPCLLPYGDLPLIQRRKDKYFQAICLAVAKSVHPEIKATEDRK